MVGTRDAKGGTVSDEIGNIDSGDTHHFDPAKSCIVIETAALSHCFGSGGDVCDLGWGPWDVGDYTFTYRITRLRDVRVGLRRLLDEAMRRIRSRSELEAIVAGLKSLRAPSPRKTEPR